MALFTYTAWNEDGVQHAGSLQARDAADARRRLRRRGLYVKELATPDEGVVGAVLRGILGWRKRERPA